MTFSDTFYITCSLPYTDEVEKYNNQILARAALICPHILSAGIRENVYLRGCISVGVFYRSPQLMVGPAVAEASRYFTLPEWVGISAAPSANNILKFYKKTPKNTIDLMDFFAKWDIPIKGGIEKNGFAINWPRRTLYLIGAADDEMLIKQAFDEMENTIKTELDTVDIGKALIWRNTYDFFSCFL